MKTKKQIEQEYRELWNMMNEKCNNLQQEIYGIKGFMEWIEKRAEFKSNEKEIKIHTE